MTATPTPTQRAKLLETEAVLRHRHLFCPEYDTCLDLAIAAGWTSWTCEHCALAAVTAEAHASILGMAAAARRFDAEHAVAGLQ